MQNWLTARIERTPDALALIYQGRSYRWFDLHILVNTWRRTTRAVLQPGQRVGVFMTNSLDAVIVLHALSREGCLAVWFNTRLTPPELSAQMEQARCTTLIYSRALHIIVEQISAANVIPIAYEDSLPTPRATLPPDQAIELTQPAAILFTSGTSGTAKGVVLSWGNFFYSAMASAYHLGTLPTDRWLCVLPLYHVGGLSIFYRACLYGISVDLYERFETETIQHALIHDPITLISLVPTQLYRLLEAQQNPWTPTLRVILLGGAAASAELIARCHEEHLPVATTYGLTEAASQVATSSPGTMIGVGKPLMFTHVSVRDEHGQETERGSIGELVVSGPTVMMGYLHDLADGSAAPAETERTYATGDMGYFDAHGDLHIVQRRSDLIVSGGENVYPAEVEAVLRQHPAVQEACVVGVPHPEWGQQVAAALVLRSEASAVSDRDIISVIRRQLAGYKLPRRFLFVTELPQTASGKIARRAVQDLFAET